MGETKATSSEWERCWQAFRGRIHTAGPTANVLESWHRGRARFAVWMLRILDDAVRDRQQAVARQVGDAIVPVRSEDVHVTAWVCGFPCAKASRDDDVPETVLAAQRTALAAARCPRLLVGVPNAFASCVFLEAHDPCGDLDALRALLSTGGAPEIRFSPYMPHVTVGRFRKTTLTSPIAEQLERLRADPRFRAVPVGKLRLELVELDALDPDRLRRRWSLEI